MKTIGSCYTIQTCNQVQLNENIEIVMISMFYLSNCVYVCTSAYQIFCAI